MQINNWSDLLANKRLSKTVRDENNDLIILGTQTKAAFKKQDQWQPYAMTVADLAAAIGGGGGVSFGLKAGTFIQIEENGDPQTGTFIPAENSEITISAISIPNGLRWRGEFTTGTPADGLGDYLQNDVVYTDLGSPSLYKTWFALEGQTVPGAIAPPTSGVSNASWGQLGVEGNPGDAGQRTATLDLYKWVNSSTVPSGVGNVPSGTSTYTWASATFTNPVTLNGWSQTIPAPTKGYYLYKATVVVTNNSTLPDTTSIDWSGATIEYLAYAGADGGAIIDVTTAEKTTDYTVLNTDAGKLIRFNTGTSTTITVTVGSLTGMQNGSQVMFTWSNGTGGTVVFAGAGIKSPNSMLNLRTLYSSATLVKLADNSFYLVGDLAPY